MAKGAQEPQQQQGDRSLDMLWLIVLIVAGVMLGWYFGKVYITMAIFKVRLYEIIAIDFVVRYWVGLAKVLNLPFPNLQELQDWATFIKSNYGSAIEFNSIIRLSNAVGKYLRFPVALMLLILGAILYFGGAAQRLRNVYDMQRLKFDENKNWPQITPVVKLDLIHAALDKAPWAVAQDPMRFCKKNYLLEEERKNEGRPTVSLRRGAAYRVLSLQLGPRWRGIDALPDYLQALFSIFAARINGDRKVSEELLDKISASSANGKLDFYNSKEILAKYRNTKLVGRTVALHGYVSTVMASMLVAAREVGVLSTAEFMWLKPLDRRMWYILNSVGRYTPVAEVAGIFAHWLAEKKLGLPLMVPMVEEAVHGLELALGDVLYKPDDES